MLQNRLKEFLQGGSTGKGALAVAHNYNILNPGRTRLKAHMNKPPVSPAASFKHTRSVASFGTQASRKQNCYGEYPQRFYTYLSKVLGFTLTPFLWTSK